MSKKLNGKPDVVINSKKVEAWLRQPGMRKLLKQIASQELSKALGPKDDPDNYSVIIWDRGDRIIASVEYKSDYAIYKTMTQPNNALNKIKRRGK